MHMHKINIVCSVMKIMETNPVSLFNNLFLFHLIFIHIVTNNSTDEYKNNQLLEEQWAP